MKQLAPDVYHLSLFPFDSIDDVTGDVLVNAGVRWATGDCSARVRRMMDVIGNGKGRVGCEVIGAGDPARVRLHSAPSKKSARASQ